ncbi:hypothetical protein D3C85_1614370 [compost metagenome]
MQGISFKRHNRSPAIDRGHFGQLIKRHLPQLGAGIVQALQDCRIRLRHVLIEAIEHQGLGHAELHSTQIDFSGQADVCSGNDAIDNRATARVRRQYAY